MAHGRSSAGAAHAMFTAALRLDPLRLEAHVELARLEVLAGDTQRARERMERLAEEYRARSRQPDAQSLLRGAEGWEAEFSAAWEDHRRGACSRRVDGEGGRLHARRRKKVPAPPTNSGPGTSLSPKKRNELFSKYSVQTLRARALLRRDPSIAHRRPGTTLAHSLRELSRGTTKREWCVPSGRGGSDAE
ncbi:MAG: tetratricopeptide repeat protein [Nannocystales bacterium]